MKLASGISGELRGRDFIDVQELIRTLTLPLEFAERLNPAVRAKYVELHTEIQASKPKRYARLWRSKFLTIDAQSLDEMIDILRHSAELLTQMRADGVTLDPNGGTSDDFASLVTTDPEIAKKYDMED